MIKAATKVLKAAPEVIKAVERGEMKVATAARLADLPKSQQTAIVKEGPKAVRAATTPPRSAAHTSRWTGPCESTLPCGSTSCRRWRLTRWLCVRYPRS